MEKFAFLIHPIELQDIYRKCGLFKYLPKTFLAKIMCHLPPFKVSKITNVKSTFAEVEGWFIGVPLTTEMMMTMDEDKVIQKIIDAGKIAEGLGAKILGLGAYTAIVGDAGHTVANNLNIPVTTGNTYTVASAFEAIKEASRLLKRDIEESEIAIVGANGSIGKVCGELACRNTKKVKLIGTDLERLQKLKRNFMFKYAGCDIGCSTSIKEGLSTADIVITVTNSIVEVIYPGDIKSGAIVCDVARPRDVSKAVQASRKDVLVIEGGVIQPPTGIEFNFNFGFPSGLAYACMAETMILTMEKRYENFSLGRDIDINKVDEISKLAAKHDFSLAGLRSFEKVINREYLQEVLINIKEIQEAK